MPINVNYSPVGLLGTLASSAGQGAAEQAAFSQGLQLRQIGLAEAQEQRQAQAQEQAFTLQRAVAESMIEQRLKTPLAGHLLEQAALKQAMKASDQKDIAHQLKAMVDNGDLDEGDYSKAMFGVLTGNHTLVTQMLAKPKPTLSNTAEFENIRGPFKERRTPLEAQLKAIQKSIADPLGLGSAQIAGLRTDEAHIQQQIDALYAQEQAAIDRLRGGQKGTEAPVAPGTASIQRVGNRSEQSIMALSRGMAGEGAAPITFAGGASTTAAKTLDPETARAILVEAGGNKERAREIARARGYQF